MYQVIDYASTVNHTVQRRPQMVLDHQVMFEAEADQEHLVIGAYLCADDSLVVYKQFDLLWWQGHEEAFQMPAWTQCYAHRYELYLNPQESRRFVECLGESSLDEGLLLKMWARFGQYYGFRDIRQLCDAHDVYYELRSTTLNRG